MQIEPSSGIQFGFLACNHCGTEVSERSVLRTKTEPEMAFCCTGCLTVFQLLRSAGLDRYYDLAKDSFSFGRALPVTGEFKDYSWIDDPEFQQLYCDKNDPLVMEFFLEGVHCTACLWLIERLPRLSRNIQDARFDMGRSVVRIKLKSDGRFSEAAGLIERLGYRPHPVRGEKEIERIQKAENRRELVRIGVVAACNANIMLFAVSLYAGADGELGQLFRWLMGLISVPALTWGAMPFYRNTWSAIRNRVISIDVPIVMAILAGVISGVWNLLGGKGELYFDSLVMLVMLLLSTRYFLRRAQQRAMRDSGLMEFLFQGTVKKRVASGKWQLVSAESLQSGDVIRVESGDRIPADGRLLAGEIFLDLSVLTGETEPVRVRVGGEIFAGSRVIEGSSEVEVITAGQATRMGQIFRQIESGHYKKSPIVSFSDKVGVVFTVVVSLISLGVFAWFIPTDPAEGLGRALALMIVTCPCVLAFAIPFTMSRHLALAARRGLLIKDGEIIERLSEVKNVLFDKTGTVTEGRLEVAFASRELSEAERHAVFALETRSRHPIGRALVRYLEKSGPLPVGDVDNFVETFGKGVAGKIFGRTWELRGIDSGDLVNRDLTSVGLYVDGELAMHFELSDQLRQDSGSVVTKMKKIGLSPWLISGDKKQVVDRVASTLGIPSEFVRSKVTPEEKAELAKDLECSVMVGDGANDAAALKAARVGIAVSGSIEVSLRAADVYITEPGLKPVLDLLEIGNQTMKLIRRNLRISGFYNVIAGYLALTGKISPLAAAVLMPLSSITVFSSATIGTKRLRELLKGRA